MTDTNMNKTKTPERPIIPIWAVVDDDQQGRAVFIHLEESPAEAIAMHTSTYPNTRLFKAWFRLQKDV